MKLLKNIFYILLPLILGIAVAIFIGKYMDYNYLIHPLLAPPTVIFPIVWTIIYLLMGIFESIFDFIVNRHIYGMVLQKAEIPKETVESISESEIAQNESNVKIVESHNVNAEVKGKQK